MSRSPLIDIRAFADDRAKDADVLTTRLNQLFEPMAGPMPTQEGQGGLSMGQPVQVAGPPQAPPPQAPPQQAPQPAPQPFADVADAGAGYTNVQLPDGTVQRREGTRSWRNNNPGNIEYGNFAESQGAVGSDGRFAVFPTYEAGRSAKESLLFESPSYRDRTISSAINRYAPPSENDTRNYVDQVANAVGVSPDTNLSDLSPQQRSTMLDAMQRVEGFKPGTVNGAQSDDMYRTVGDALGVTTSTSGETTPEERRTIEGDLGAILNETQNPDSVVAANKRQGVADLFTGLGVGFGQMSRGDRVDLSEVRDAAAQRRREQTALRMERAKRAAGASYAMELGDENMARAIAGGAANIGDLLTVRQQNEVNARANAQILQQAQQSGLLANALRDAGASDNIVAAAEAGAPMSDLSKVIDMNATAEAAADLEARVDRDSPMAQEMFADAQAMLRAERLGEPMPDSQYADLLADPTIRQSLLQEGINGFPSLTSGGPIIADFGSGTRAAAEARASNQAQAGVDPIEAQNNLNAANTILSDPDSRPDDIAAAARVVQGQGATSPRDEMERLPEGSADTETMRLYDDARARAEAKGPEALAEFDARYPDGALSLKLQQAGRLGGIEDSPTTIRESTVSGDLPEIGDSNDGSLLGSARVLGGVKGVGRQLSRAVFGQVTGSAADPVFTTVETAYNSWRNDAIQSLRAGGRLLAQELKLIEQDVAPKPGVSVPPEVFADKLETIDGELRRKLDNLERAGQALVDSGLRDGKAFSDNVEARSAVESVLLGLHQPKPMFEKMGIGQPEEPGVSEVEVAPIPEAVRSGPGFADLEAAADNAGVTPEDVWSFLSEAARESFMSEEN